MDVVPVAANAVRLPDDGRPRVAQILTHAREEVQHRHRYSLNQNPVSAVQSSHWPCLSVSACGSSLRPEVPGRAGTGSRADSGWTVARGL